MIIYTPNTNNLSTRNPKITKDGEGNECNSKTTDSSQMAYMNLQANKFHSLILLALQLIHFT